MGALAVGSALGAAEEAAEEGTQERQAVRVRKQVRMEREERTWCSRSTETAVGGRWQSMDWGSERRSRSEAEIAGGRWRSMGCDLSRCSVLEGRGEIQLNKESEIDP